MHDLDHMLNGKSSRQHHQDMIQWVQQDRFAHEFESARGNRKPVPRLRAVLVTLLNIVIMRR